MTTRVPRARATRAWWADLPSGFSHEVLDVVADARVGELPAANLEHFAVAHRFHGAIGLQHPERAHVPVAAVRADRGQIDLDDGVAALLDVQDLDLQIGKDRDRRV